MKNAGEKYRCSLCGTEVTVTRSGAGTLVCCGKGLKPARVIGAGFLLVVSLFLAVNMFAVYNLTGVKKITEFLSEENLPVIAISNKIERIATNAFVLTQNYLFSGEKKTVKDIQVDLYEIRRLLDEGFTLSKRYPRFKQLGETVNQIGGMVRQYEQGLIAIVDLTNGLRADQNRALDSVRMYLDTAEKFSKVQMGELNGEINIGVKPEKLQQRTQKIQLIQGLIGLGYKIEKVGLRAQVTRDPKTVKDADVLFKEVSRYIGSLREITKHKDLRKMLDDIEKAQEAAQTAYMQFAVKLQKKEKEEQNISQLSPAIIAKVKETSEAGLKDIHSASGSFSRSLTSTASALIAGAMVSVLVGISIAMVLVRMISQKEMTKV